MRGRPRAGEAYGAAGPLTDGPRWWDRTCAPIAYLGRYHWMLYFLAVAIRPRMLMTVNESGEPLTVTARVGQVRARRAWGGARVYDMG